MNKKLCIGIAALTSAFMMGGCFGKSDPPPTNPTLTAAQKNEAYTSLRTISNTPLYDTTSATGSQLTVKTSIDVDTSTDFSKSGLNTSDIEELKDNFFSGYADFNLGIGVKAIAGLRADNTGYLKGYGSISGIEMLAAQEITRKEGDNYYVYSKVDAEKTKSLVDENYAKNAYSLASFFGDDEDSTATLANLELLQEILTSVADNETLDEFKLIASNIAKNAILSNQEGNYATYFTGIDVSNISASAAVDITLTDGVYELKTTMAIDDIATTVGTKNNKTDIDTDVSIKFDKNSIKDISVSVGLNQDTTEKCSDALDEEEYNVVFTDNNILETNQKITAEFSVAKGEFSETILNQTLTGYEGTGENNEVENRQTNITFKCADCKALSFDDDYEATFGDNIIETFNAALEDNNDYDYSEFSNIKLYYDKECLQEVSATDTLPSYDTTLYFKIEVPDTQAYAYVTINTQYGSMTYTTHDYDMYTSGTTLTFSNFTSGNIISVKVNGETVTSETITLENKQVYDIVINCVSNY